MPAIMSSAGMRLRHRHAARPNRPSGRNASSAAIGTEDHEIGELRKHHLPERIEKADQKAADADADQAAAAADDDDRKAEHQNLGIGRRIQRQKRAAHQPAEAGQRRAEQEGDEEDAADIDPGGLHHLGIIDAGADQARRAGCDSKAAKVLRTRQCR